jgi:peptide-methionine (S)-S-oxide reductase
MADPVPATFGAGCFWGVEHRFSKVKGVVETAVGFMGGTTKDPTYEEVCSDRSGHIEVVQLLYDPDLVPYVRLLEVFWAMHDPTSLDRQGPDKGSQYRSVIFYHDEEQRKIAERSKEEQERSGQYHKPLVTKILPATVFYRADERHQRYLEKQGRGVC